MNKKFIAGIAAIAAVTFFGCSGPRPFQRTSAFDASKAKQMMEPGTNKVSGSAFRGNGRDTCTGSTVYLIPVTTASTEWVRDVYGDDDQNWSDESGVHPSFVKHPDSLDPEDPIFKYSLKADCDLQGRFQFDNVSNGDYYLFWETLWERPLARGMGTYRGASIMRKIRLKGGDSIDQLMVIKD
jgi:hypothetical protein